MGEVLSEDGPWVDDTVSFIYANRLRTGMSVLAPDAAAWTQTYTHDDENQLVSVYVTNVWESDFVYDGKMRRRERFESVWIGGTRVTNAVTLYVYDGNVVVQERNANNLPAVTYTRGLDLSGSLQGAGGIGGLLGRTDNSALATQPSAAHAYYHADGNGNITCLINSQQSVMARYLYDPFGSTLSQSGPSAAANLYRFSSKEFHVNSGLVYYLYRFYDPNLQRWPNRDPIGESGGVNLYAFVSNDPADRSDAVGLSDENRPPVTVSPSGGAQYGPPCRLSPDQCAALLASIMSKIAKLKNELAKYDPSADGTGGFPMPGGGTTKPGGHYREMQNLLRGIRNDIKQYLKDCSGGGNPPIPKGVSDTVNQPIPPPILHAPKTPVYGPLPWLPVPAPVPVPAFP